MPSIIPLTDDASSIEVLLEEREITFETMFNSRGGFWAINVSEGANTLFTGLPLTLGHDIFETMPELYLGSLVMFDTTLKGVEASFDSLGNTTVLLHFTEQEKEDAQKTLLASGSFGGAFSNDFDQSEFF